MIDKGTLMTVVGVKKWAIASKEKRAQANLPLRKHAKNIENRLMNELPQTLYLDLIAAMMPILKRCEKEYKKQLGDRHFMTIQCGSHIQALQIKGRKAGSDLPSMLAGSIDSLQANTDGLNTVAPPEDSCCIPIAQLLSRRRDRGRVGVLNGTENKQLITQRSKSPEGHHVVIDMQTSNPPKRPEMRHHK
jgi:hypothetical protein